MQPVVMDDRKVIRFQKNAVVAWLFDKGAINLNELALQGFPAEDKEQVLQLLGLSVSGFSEYDYATPETIEQANRLAMGLLALSTQGTKQNGEPNHDWREGFAAGRSHALVEMREELADLIKDKLRRR